MHASADAGVHRINPGDLEACCISRCSMYLQRRPTPCFQRQEVYLQACLSWHGLRRIRKLVVVVVLWETQVRHEGRRMGMGTQPRESMLNFVCPRSHELFLVHITSRLPSNHHGVSSYPSNVSHFEYLASPSDPWMDLYRRVKSLDHASRFTACNFTTYCKKAPAHRSSELSRTSLKLTELKTCAPKKPLRLIYSVKYSEKGLHSCSTA